MAKKAGSPSITAQRASMPAPRAYASSVWSISATPPPAAVELTLITELPASFTWVASAIRSNRAKRSGPIKGSSRATSSA
jgi:hypothetical protein